ncbi:MAG: hypothetical protein J6N54_03365, partial [Bacteroidales bacterium]|nr:hypothetical protein [Bacteroidales bacterium]
LSGSTGRAWRKNLSVHLADEEENRRLWRIFLEIMDGLAFGVECFFIGLPAVAGKVAAGNFVVLTKKIRRSLATAAD